MKIFLTLGVLLLTLAAPGSLAAQQSPSRLDDGDCAGFPGHMARGAVDAGVVTSIIGAQNGTQATDLTEDEWGHGTGDGDADAVITRGLPPTLMARCGGHIPDAGIWSIVNHLRTLPPK